MSPATSSPRRLWSPPSVRRLRDFIESSTNPAALVEAIEAIANSKDHGYPQLEFANSAHAFNHPKMVLVADADAIIVYETIGVAPVWVLGLVAIVPVNAA